MSNSIYKTTSNELIQEGTYVVSYADLSSNKKYNRLQVSIEGLISCRYYLVAEEEVETDVSCGVELLTLAGTAGTLTIKAGTKKSENYLSSVFLKLARIVSGPTPAESNGQIYLVGASLQDGKLDNILAKNVLNDYKDGVYDSEMTIDCADYDSLNQTGYINWSDAGNTVGLNSGILKEDNGTYYRVTGRTFSKEGAPFETLEIKRIYKE